MQTHTYEQQRQKIIDAYFKNEIRPMSPQFCFCGALSPDSNWDKANEKYPYTVEEYARMEGGLLKPLNRYGLLFRNVTKPFTDMVTEFHEEYEEKLFIGMCAALDVLKEIHRERGENVDELPALTKRVLVQS